MQITSKFRCSFGRRNNKKAQIVTEYALVFFLAIAVITAMSVFLRRVLQGRYRDARDTMVSLIEKDVVGINVPKEYEPYYMNTESNINATSDVTLGLSGGGSTGVASKTIDETTNVTTNSIQAPPKDAD